MVKKHSDTYDSQTFAHDMTLSVSIYLSSTYLHINEAIKGSQALMDNKIYLKKYRDFFSSFMRFSHYAVFPRKLKTHKRRTKCIIKSLK